MIRMKSFTATLKKFKDKGEKTGWTYIEIPARLANGLKPGTKTSFRVKGKLDRYPIRQIALLPMGNGDFIMAINGSMRRGLKKKAGDQVAVTLELDRSEFQFSEDFLLCLEDDPVALENFKKLAPSHQKYFSKWIADAKTVETKTKRITQAVQGLAMGLDYGAMIRYFRDKS